MPCPTCSAKKEDACAPTFVKCTFGKSPCGGSALAKSPCGICGPSRAACSLEPARCDRFAGSFLVDILAAVIFFFFWMMQFWLNIANCLYKVILCLIKADRPIQLVVAALFIILFGSMILTGIFRGGPCPKCKNAKVKMSSCASRKSCSDLASSSTTKAAEVRLKQQQMQHQQEQQKKKESIKSSSPTSSQKSSPTFKIKCKDSKNACAGPIDKTFYLTITDERKKKLYEACVKFSLLSKDQKPKLLLTTDPIIIENY